MQAMGRIILYLRVLLVFEAISACVGVRLASHSSKEMNGIGLTPCPGANLFVDLHNVKSLIKETFEKHGIAQTHASRLADLELNQKAFPWESENVEEEYTMYIPIDPPRLVCAPPGVAMILTVTLQNTSVLGIELKAAVSRVSRNCLVIKSYEHQYCPEVSWIGEDADDGSMCPPSLYLFNLVLVLTDPSLDPEAFSLVPSDCLQMEDAASAFARDPKGGKYKIPISPYQVISSGRPFYARFGFVPVGTTTLDISPPPIRFDAPALENYCAKLHFFRLMGKTAFYDTEENFRDGQRIVDAAKATGLDENILERVTQKFGNALLIGKKVFPDSLNTVQQIYEWMKRKGFHCDSEEMCTGYELMSQGLSNSFKELFSPATSISDEVFVLIHGDAAKSQEPLHLTQASCANGAVFNDATVAFEFPRKKWWHKIFGAAVTAKLVA